MMTALTVRKEKCRQINVKIEFLQIFAFPFSWHPCLELFFLCFKPPFKLQVFRGLENIISATSHLYKVTAGAARWSWKVKEYLDGD